MSSAAYCLAEMIEVKTGVNYLKSQVEFDSKDKEADADVLLGPYVSKLSASVCIELVKYIIGKNILIPACLTTKLQEYNLVA